MHLGKLPLNTIGSDMAMPNLLKISVEDTRTNCYMTVKCFFDQAFVEMKFRYFKSERVIVILADTGVSFKIISQYCIRLQCFQDEDWELSYSLIIIDNFGEPEKGDMDQES